MSQNNVPTGSGGGIGFFGIMFLIFMTLKLTDKIDWSWWWVTAPLWGPLVIGLALMGVFLLIIGLCVLIFDRK